MDSTTRVLSGTAPVTTAEVSVIITRVLNEYLMTKDDIASDDLYALIGLLECTKAELYNRIVSPFQDSTLEEHGEFVELEFDVPDEPA